MIWIEECWGCISRHSRWRRREGRSRGSPLQRRSPGSAQKKTTGHPEHHFLLLDSRRFNWLGEVHRSLISLQNIQGADHLPSQLHFLLVALLARQSGFRIEIFLQIHPTFRLARAYRRLAEIKKRRELRWM